MSVDDVAVWLQRAGFGALEGAFRANFERREAAGLSLWVDRELKAGQQRLEGIAEADGVSADYAHLKLRIPKDYEVMLAGLTHTAQLGPEAPHVDAACRALADGLRAFGLPGPRAAPHGGRGPHHGPATP
eukprot:tig00020681_g12834.t1